MRSRTVTEFLLTVAEPTRLRILNCLAAAPLFVSDLQAVLDLPQPTVSRHLQVLRKARLVRDTPVAQYVLYRLQRDLDRGGRLLGAHPVVVFQRVQDGAERNRALDRSRTHTRARVPEVPPDLYRE